MVGKALIFGFFVVALAATPALAREARKETCLEVSVDGSYKFKIPCPPGVRPLLKQLPVPAEPAPRRGIVIDPQWPHDQAMAPEHDWPHDSAMIVPRNGESKPAVPLFDQLLGAIERDVRESKVRQLLEDWLPGKSK